MHWRDVPAFYASLNECSVTHLALRLLMLPGFAPARFGSSETTDRRRRVDNSRRGFGRRDATLDFRVPPITVALSIIDQTRRHAREGYLLPSIRWGVISMTMAKLMERREMDARHHGLRSSLRDWIGDDPRPLRGR